MQKRSMEENQFQDIPKTFAPGRSQKHLPKKTVVLLAVIVLAVLVFLFVKLSGKTNNQSTSTASTVPTSTETPFPSSTPENSPSPSPTPSSTPTPKPTANPVDKTTGLDRSKLSVLVQNGSGESGAAGKASDFLKNLGYNVLNTANADNYDYTNVVVRVKSTKSDFLSLLKKDLGFNYTIGTTSADLSDSSTEDALVIIGK